MSFGVLWSRQPHLPAAFLTVVPGVALLPSEISDAVGNISQRGVLFLFWAIDQSSAIKAGW